MNRKGFRAAFTLVELLIVIAILTILSGAAYIGIQRSQARVMNEKVFDDLAAIVNALEQFRQDEGEYPAISNGFLTLEADKNVNCFAEDTSYEHNCGDAAFIQAFVDNNLLTKRYLQEVPTDPRTGSRYVYGVTGDGQFFEVAGVYFDSDGNPLAKVEGNVEQGFELPSLIRAFDGPNFVMDNEGYLPYSPDHLSITATLDDVTGEVKVDDGSGAVDVFDGTVVHPGDWIITGLSASVVLYFSDGSITYLDEDTRLRLLPNSEVPQNDEDGIITKIRLKLLQGKIWNKVARLASESEFNVETTTSIAGVRGTEFGIDKDDKLIVRSGKVAARKKEAGEVSATQAPDTFLEFTVKDIPETAVGDNTLKEFIIPPLGQNMLQAAPLTDNEKNEINLKFYKAGFNNNTIPRIMEVDTSDANPGNWRIVFKLVEGVTDVEARASDDNTFLQSWVASQMTTDLVNETMKITPTANPGVVTNRPAHFRFRDADGNLSAWSDVSVIVAEGVAMTEDDLYNLGLAQQQQGAVLTVVQVIPIDGITRVRAGEQNKAYQATAQYSSGPDKPIAAQDCTWQLSNIPGNVTIDGVFQIDNGVTASGEIKCEYTEGNVTIAGSHPIEVLLELRADCYGVNYDDVSDDIGYWDDISQTCWVLAQDDTMTCDNVCTQQIPNNSAQCNPTGQWNDDANCTICETLLGQPAGQCSPNINIQTPFVLGNNLCRYRNEGQQPTTDCGVAPGVSERRICACITL